jgi:hypothetical protein
MIAIKDSMMTINEHELKQLLRGEINCTFVVHDEYNDKDGCLFLSYGFSNCVWLEYYGEQDFFIVDSDNDDMFPGETINVDEILDIVL